MTTHRLAFAELANGLASAATRLHRCIARALAPPLERVPAAADFVPRLVELRSYLAQPGQREKILDLFERHFLDAYQAGGTRVLGCFRDLDEPDRWVWLRAFPDAASRGARLRNFYDGEVWQAHAEACNSAIADIQEALLLRAREPDALNSLCAPAQSADRSAAVIVAHVHALDPGQEDAFADFHRRELAPLLARGATRVADFSSDTAPNSYPRQPVRAAPVFVALTRYATPAAARQWRAARTALEHRCSGRLETWRLQPTARSAIR
jgi:hypothetical protein